MNKRLFILFSALCLNTGFSYGQSTKPSVLWCDPLLNIRTLTTRGGILNVVNKAKTNGFQGVAIGVKAITGEVLYKSDVAPRLLEWNNYRVPLDFDLVRLFVEEARKRGLQVYAVFPVFAEGHMLERSGTVYSQHPDWQSEVYVVEKDEPAIIPITQWAYGPVAFANPLLPSVQNYEISLITEFIKKYNVDGLILDKVRFSGIEADFSKESRRQFETYQGGKKVDWWPDDVLQWQLKDDVWQPVPGKLFVQWVEFRASAMKTYLDRLLAAVKKADPIMPVGNFAGAWYPTYYEYGVNWASETNIPEETWASRNYYRTAIAEDLSYSVVGCFFPRVTMDDAEKAGADWWMSVEGSAIIAMDVVNKATPVYGTLLAEQFRESGEVFKESLRLALNLTDGLYVTDFSQVERYKFWDEIREVLTGATSPRRVLRQ